jgi:hypothetical protein
MYVRCITVISNYSPESDGGPERFAFGFTLYLDGDSDDDLAFRICLSPNCRSEERTRSLNPEVLVSACHCSLYCVVTSLCKLQLAPRTVMVPQ